LQRISGRGIAVPPVLPVQAVEAMHADSAQT
jgi:hypothetical protein